MHLYVYSMCTYIYILLIVMFSTDERLMHLYISVFPDLWVKGRQMKLYKSNVTDANHQSFKYTF